MLLVAVFVLVTGADALHDRATTGGHFSCALCVRGTPYFVHHQKRAPPPRPHQYLAVCGEHFKCVRCCGRYKWKRRQPTVGKLLFWGAHYTTHTQYVLDEQTATLLASSSAWTFAARHPDAAGCRPSVDATRAAGCLSSWQACAVKLAGGCHPDCTYRKGQAAGGRCNTGLKRRSSPQATTPTPWTCLAAG